MNTFDELRLDHIDLFSLEGEDEIFVDKLSDEGVFDLTLGQIIQFGTYKNNFKCLALEKYPIESNCLSEIKYIRCQFYGIDEEVFVKIVTTLDPSGELIDRKAFWIDKNGSQIPSDHKRGAYEIKENCDIFEE